MFIGTVKLFLTFLLTSSAMILASHPSGPIYQTVGFPAAISLLIALSTLQIRLLQAIAR